MNKHNPKTRQIIYCDTGIKRVTWCGPFSVATVAGIEYEPAVACKQLGLKGKWTHLEKKRKLSKFVPENLEQGKVYIIQITRHVLVMDTRDWTTIDNQVPEWRAMDASHHWSKKLVHAFYEVENPKFDSHCDDQFTFDFDLVA